MDVCTATSTGHRKLRVSKKNRSWHRRLHLRKTVVQPPAMQSQDKNGPKKIAKKWEQTSVWPKEPPREARVTNDGGSTLRFPCSQCGDNSDYAPKDLVRHFMEMHGGSLPVFSCHMCTFSAHEFSYLQVHLLSHKDTFSTCSMCNDNIQRTWPEFSAHLSMYHCSDGKYSCETCKKFSTCDFRVFLDHIYKHNLTVEDKEVGGQFCGGEAPEKWLINKSVKTAHVCQNGNQRKDGRRIHSIAMTPSERIPRVKTRLTRSTVRDTCWLTQDCLSLPGKEFLDKYCHLSDPQTTLEETQQFLMQSVAGETDDQKWTKALKSVLSNVPQKNSENGIVPNTSDLAVLTVKNKITLAQNGAAYAKRLKMASADKEPTCPQSADSDSLCASDQKGFSPNLKNQALCLTENKPRSDFSSSGAGTQENRENRKLKTDSEIQENSEKLEEPIDDVGKSSDLKLPNESEGKMKRPRWRRKARFKKVQRKPEGKVLKIVIKKNLVKGKQWVSQSSSSPKHVEIDGHVEPPIPQQNAIKGSPAGLPDPSRRTAICDSVQPTEAKDTRMENEHRDDLEESQDFSDRRGSAEGTSETNSVAASVTNVRTPHEEPALQKSNEETEEKRSPAASSPHGKANLDLSLERPAEQSDQGSKCEEASTDFSQHLLSGVQSPGAEASQREPSAAVAARPQWHLVPKHQPRTLRLVAVNQSQPVKRPAGDQPVVVLNHPDADIPQVARIMEVVNKYRQVRRVLLSRHTLRALSVLSGGGAAAMTNNLMDDQGKNSVQERFTLRLKFRRVSRKKYEIVGVASPGRDASSRISCWFCGRVFASQEEMMLHRQRHLMDWRKPNCEKS
ncbi:zinc finger protein 518A-like [Poeciliopsis prolifica]|uniref:zinc finger protein 518A-like n=1 Tax=Poeciliopsis prolifica TaxID=188132 RepID=UPI002413DAD6|nr:zinc finger protein 518A-like [Poeciliopsis prolifica]